MNTLWIIAAIVLGSILLAYRLWRVAPQVRHRIALAKEAQALACRDTALRAIFGDSAGVWDDR